MRRRSFSVLCSVQKKPKPWSYCRLRGNIADKKRLGAKASADGRGGKVGESLKKKI